MGPKLCQLLTELPKVKLVVAPEFQSCAANDVVIVLNLKFLFLYTVAPAELVHNDCSFVPGVGTQLP